MKLGKAMEIDQLFVQVPTWPKQRPGETNQVLGFQLSKWRRTLKAMLIDLATKQNIYGTHYFTKYWLLGTLKIYTCSGPISDLLNQNISSKRF